MNANPSSPPAHARTAAKKQHQLPPTNLSPPCDPQQLGFATTAQLPDLQDVIGQPRAFRALELGSEVRSIGYNVFVLGIPDSGRSTLTREYLKRKAAHEPTMTGYTSTILPTRADPLPFRCQLGVRRSFAKT